MTKEVQKWADVAMFEAAPIDVGSGPKVTLLSCNSDPLGTIVAAAKMYKGEYVDSLAEITDAERRYYLADVRKSALAAPLEFVNFHFHISGVTRGFTHQMVRQRTATYTQESTRFAVKSTMPVGIPPSLEGTLPWREYVAQQTSEFGIVEEDWIFRHATKEQRWRAHWDAAVAQIDSSYNWLVEAGMPAEDARGLLPTNLLTRINYNTSLRGLLDHAGVRLCTQAQFEWRLVWNKMIQAIQDYGPSQTYARRDDGILNYESSKWQFNELATIFKPICYQKGSCQFLSDVDRHCSIRDRVQRNAKLGRPSTEWDKPTELSGMTSVDNKSIVITDSEWMLDPESARISQ